jgi:hypothetical protein
VDGTQIMKMHTFVYMQTNKMENGSSGIQKEGIDLFNFACVLYEVHSRKRNQTVK